MTRLLESDYYHPELLGARYLVASVCGIWGALLVFFESALFPTLYGRLLVGLLPEDAFGYTYLAVAIIALTRLAMRARPCGWIDAPVYFVMMIGLLFTASFNLLSVWPPWPTTTSLAIPVALVSIYAFVARPRKGVPCYRI